MTFGRIDNAISVCSQHLDDTNSRNTEVESFLVQYLLVLITSEYDLRLKRLVEIRVSKSEDDQILSFASYACGKIVRGSKISDIRGNILRPFGATCDQTFEDEVIDTEGHVAYDSIIANRHSVAHATGANLTFSELEHNYKKSKAVLDAVAKALDLTDDDLKNL